MRSQLLPASISPSHLALRGSVDHNCTSRAPTALLALCLLMPPFPSVLPLCLTTFPRSCLWCLRSSSGRIFSRSSQFFPPPAARLSLASSFACGGPRRAIFGQLLLGGVFLLHDSSRPARRTAKAWRLRPARGTAPRVSGSRQSVLHERQGNAAAAVTTAAAAAAGRRVQHIAGGRAVQVRPLHLPRSDTGRSSAPFHGWAIRSGSSAHCGAAVSALKI